MASPVLLGQMTGGEGTETAGRTGDQGRAPGVDRPRQDEHELADVLALAQMAEGLWRLAHVPGLDRGVIEGTGLDRRGDLSQHLPGARWAGFGYVEGHVGDAGVIAAHLPGVADVGLAHLKESPAAGQEGKRGVDELAGEGIEDDVDALATGRCEEFVFELQIARGGDV